ncbi:hypothetical protein [Frondihabitans sp. VKM Ac-2883]|uniref:hypothetical protein n=1 Tax=Frondihabitans sp. VKM Ac-2883 TaxID=2783823 RepID=UPI00188C704F|nr:hypothetical protein [Frondihabitans sp. VKM Ac-2883]MBF4576182.1 hypothetical protein [Frondihabitans sp. VKM Ac-2883]
MSDSRRRSRRPAFIVPIALAIVAAGVLAAGAAIDLLTGAAAPWLVGVAVILILSLTWLASLRRK